ncbi:unnamed protein product [Bursaphelenchus xylophilus]|uniref:Hexosyltransferase n=1 Tax=Bursaphelenchus xylophilus TaxID=6326 RepID=A0A1I7S625_BURXY|nr:unnamed protein product [Bursaphelenchus xylophilus]CAG9082352.1 unnamed protein product [Bursaphelenchus xylophilus]
MSWLKNSYIWVGCVVTLQLLIFAVLLAVRPSFESLVPLIGYYTNRSLNVTWNSLIYNSTLLGNGGLNWSAVYRFDQQLDPFLADLMETVTLTFKDHRVDYQMTRPVNSNVCDGVDAVVYVMTTLSRQATERRNIVRNALFNETNLPKNYTILHRYVVARFPAENDYQQNLIKEVKEFDDIIMMNIDDDYRRNYIKWHTMHAWHMRHCPRVKNFIKIDDDVIIYLKRLFQWVDRDFGGIVEGKDKYFVCDLINKGKVFRDLGKHKKVFVTYEQFPQRYYPSYCNGPVVITTNETISEIMKIQETVNYITVDDVLYTGIVRDKAGISLLKFDGINGRNAGCSADGLPLYTSWHGKGKGGAQGVLNVLEEIKNVKCNKE